MTIHPEAHDRRQREAGDMTMVERVARAIYFAGEGLGPESWFCWENDAHWQHWWREDRAFHEAQARAAIAAMREPSEGMVSAAVERGFANAGTDMFPEDIERECWRASIDAALAEHDAEREAG